MPFLPLILRRPLLTAGLSLTFCVALLYGHTLHAPWYFDDQSNLLDNPAIRYLDAAFGNAWRHRGIALLSFAVNYRLGGFNLPLFHLTNLAIHGLASWLVFLLLRRVFRNEPWWALAGGLIFCAHPLQTQSVTYIVQRMTSLSGCLTFLALLLYLRARELSGGQAPWTENRATINYLLALGAGWGALASKETAVVIPLLLLLFERFFLQDTKVPWRRQILFLAPFCLAPLIYGFVMVVQPLISGTPLSSVTGTLDPDDPAPLRYLFTEFQVLWLYLRLLIIPWPQQLFYNFPLVDTLFNLPSLLALAGLIALGYASWRYRQRQPRLAFAYSWFLIALAVESTLLPLDRVFEHRLYLPMFGFAVASVDLATRLPRPRLAVIVLGLYLLTLGSLTWQRNQQWTDPVALLEDNLRRSPGNVLVLNDLAKYHIDRGNVRAAEPLLRRALSLNPEHLPAYINLIGLYFQSGRLAEALPMAEAGVQRFPQAVDLHDDLGMIYLARGEHERGLNELRRAVALNPHLAATLANLGRALLQLQRPTEAEDALRRAALQSPRDGTLQRDLAIALYEQGRHDEARHALWQACRIEPDNPDYWLRLGLLAVEDRDQATTLTALTALERLSPAAAASLRQQSAAAQ